MKLILSILLLLGILTPAFVSAQQMCSSDSECPLDQQCEDGFCQNTPGFPGGGSVIPGGSSGGNGDGGNIPGGSGGGGGGGQSDGLTNPLRFDTLEEFFEAMLGFIVRIGTIIVVVMIVIVGFMFVSARGNPEKIKDARTALLWTLVGAVILIGASIIAEAIRATVEAISSGS